MACYVADVGAVMAGPRTTVHINDRVARRILANLEKFQSYEFQMVIKGNHPTRNETVAKIAFWHEFGTNRMPARPFIREAQKRKDTVAAVAVKEVGSMISGRRTAETAARRIAQAMAKAAVDAIDDSTRWAVPLSPITIHKKGHSHPLIETELMRKSIYWRVVRDGVILQEGRSASAG